MGDGGRSTTAAMDARRRWRRAIGDAIDRASGRRRARVTAGQCNSSTAVQQQHPPPTNNPPTHPPCVYNCTAVHSTDVDYSRNKKKHTTYYCYTAAVFTVCTYVTHRSPAAARPPPILLVYGLLSCSLAVTRPSPRSCWLYTAVHSNTLLLVH